jgi:hypothetical protein
VVPLASEDMTPVPPPTNDWPAALSHKTASQVQGDIDHELLASIIEEQFDPAKHSVTKLFTISVTFLICN